MTRALAVLLAMLSGQPMTAASLSGPGAPEKAMLPERPPPRAPPLVARDGEALVYISRPGSLEAIWAATFLVDGVKVASLYQGRCTALKVPAGRHLLAVHWSWLSAMPNGDDIAMRVETGRSYYQRLNVRIESQYPKVTLSWWMTEGEARDFDNCYYVKPVNLDKLAAPGPSTKAAQ